MKIRLVDHRDIPSFLEDVAKCCLGEMSEQTRQTLREQPDPVRYHLGIGAYIRNEFIYPQTEYAATVPAAKELVARADDYSARVIEIIMEALNQ